VTGRPGSAPARTSRGRVYLWVHEPSRDSWGRVVETVVELPRLDDSGAGHRALRGRHVCVRNAAVIPVPGPVQGSAVSAAVGDAQADENGDFLFQPQRGGARLDKSRLRKEPYRRRYVEASHFGEVNTYFHVDRIAAHVNSLLSELGAPLLPRVVVLVNAHHAAVPLADGTRDGILQLDRWVPFQGGHYRLPSHQHGVPEREPLSPEGEIHLGPGWKLLEHGELVAAAGGRYRHIASHNAGTIYHEYGHHIARHTADFRGNALRPPDRQSNIKPALEEGFCDYWAATLLDTPHIWAWHRRHDEREIHERSLTSSLTLADFDNCEQADPHDVGTVWAAAMWELRTRMQASRPDGARACDRLALQALLLIGAQPAEPPGGLQRLRRQRASFAGALGALLRADAMLHGGAFRDALLDGFGRRGIEPAERPAPIANGVVVEQTPSAADRDIKRRARTDVQLHSGWEETPEALQALEQARTRLLDYVPAEDIPETHDLFGRGELGARLRALGEPPLSVLASGDTMLGGRSDVVIAEHGLGYPLKALRPLLRRACIVLGNLEGPIASQATSQPRNFSYRVEPRMAVALKRARFHVMSVANNHLTDCGREGVTETLQTLTRHGIAPLGAGADERAAHAPVIREARGLRIALLGYYWNRRTAARDGLPGSAMDPPESLAEDIGRAREQADRVVVTFHWGVPYVREPSPEDRAKARFAVDCGADAVVGHHVHVIQPFEIWRDRPIFYGIGNCAFGSGNSKAEGLLVGFDFEPQHTRVSVYALYVKNRDPRVDYQPKVLRGESARRVFARLIELSGADGAALQVGDFRATMQLPRSRVDRGEAPGRPRGD
jgi:Bacterial capsule synthesis protein PGA_cap/Fungalysin metallopeptidase (M36)